MPQRIARHAYDLHQMMQSGVGAKALADLKLLKRVAQHKTFFYNQAEVDYNAAANGGLKVVSTDHPRQKEIAEDYAAMRDFFMFQPPNFEDILESLKIIEQHANK